MIKSLVIVAFLGIFFLSGCNQKEYREYRREQVRYQNPKWDEVTVEKVALKKVEPGMTPDMVRASMGVPDDVTNRDGTEKWSYAVLDFDGEHVKKRFVYFVYFKNGEVARIDGDRRKLETLR
jgi:outer membrane protein assembly factor BamE (lipoprotein component of BamABCDE complex)